jgi:hypothetical protein
MVAERAVGISHAMNVTENLGGHGAHCSDGLGPPPFQKRGNADNAINADNADNANNADNASVGKLKVKR